MIRSFFQPLRRRLLLLVALALMVPSAFGIWAAIDRYDEGVGSARAAARSYASLASNYENNLLRQAGQITETLSLDSGVQRAAIGGDTAQCYAAMRQAIAPYPHFSVAALVAVDGDAICQSEPALKLRNVRDRRWFQEAISSGAPALSSRLISPTLHEPVIAYGLPLFDGDKNLLGVVTLAIRLSWLETAGQEPGLPPGSEVGLLDRDGVLLVSSVRDPALRAGALPDDAYFSRISQSGLRRFEAPGGDGMMRLYAVNALAGNSLFVLFSQPWQDAIGELRMDLFVQIFILALVNLAGLLTAAFAGRLLVTRWTEKLTAAAAAMKLGELSADTEWRGAPREIHDLADTLQVMAQKIEHRESDLRDSLEQKQLMLREIHHRVKNNLQIVTSLLSLYERQMKGAPGAHAFPALQLRIKSLGLVHRYLYESDTLRGIALAPFLTHLCTLLQDNSGVPAHRVKLSAELSDITVSGDRAIPLALLTTELVLAAFHYGFPGNRAGHITLSAELTDADDCLFTISDNGAVGPRQDESDPAGRLSATLVAAFARQLGGSFETETTDITTHRFVFRPHATGMHGATTGAME